ncbi:MAG: hypothetical protein GTO02_03070 [Candidatus Dadabacteria bacterium]|nr:hypothetical protein [Candidatus Dadabacteria bacterium]NIQ13411.1 hypothetical protein [Candidatus Dadabacteria bacterium]
MKFLILIILTITFFAGCTGIHDTEVFKSKVSLEENEFNSDIETVISEIKPILKWLKWDIAFASKKNGLITLREAYVYRKNDKLLRIYHYPDKEFLKKSGISDYIKKVTKLKYGFLHGSIAFTQETMRINLIEVDEVKVKVEIEYLIRTYDSDHKKLHDAQSNGYIEKLIIEKLRERLSNTGPRR